MKFKLSMTQFFFSDGEEMKEYKKLGLRFKKYKDFPPFTHRITDYEPTIEINTIHELVEFTKRHGQVVFNCDSIEIYNDHRE